MSCFLQELFDDNIVKGCNESKNICLKVNFQKRNKYGRNRVAIVFNFRLLNNTRNMIFRFLEVK